MTFTLSDLYLKAGRIYSTGFFIFVFWLLWWFISFYFLERPLRIPGSNVGRLSEKFHLSLFLTISLTLPPPFFASGARSHPVNPVSLKQYSNLSVVVPNPLDLTKLPFGKSFQVTHPDFILQFFFDKRDIFGIIFKRNLEKPIHMRWCFFKSCENSPYDFKVVIANPHSPPFDQGFFSVKFPPGLQYRFQGLEFTSGF